MDQRMKARRSRISQTEVLARPRKVRSARSSQLVGGPETDPASLDLECLH